MRHDDEPIVVEQTYNASVETVWNAITQIDLMKQWYFDVIPAFEPVVGFATRFDIEHEGRLFPHVWKVTEVVPQKFIEYDWRYDGYDGDSFVAFELSAEGDQCTLRLTHTVKESFPDIPEFNREGGIAGWEYFINGTLKQFLESDSQCQVPLR